MKKIILLKNTLLFGLIIFLIGNILLYTYCFITPRIILDKNQSYFFYDSDGKTIFNDSDKWISINDLQDNDCISDEIKEKVLTLYNTYRNGR